MKPAYDVAIIGGGLAGCSAAVHLAARGKRVIVLEAKTYPHHKVCGEFLSPECATLLDELGLTETITAYHPKQIDIVRITAPDGTSWTTRLPGTAWGISRYVLDDALARHARACGVEISEQTVASAIDGDLENGFRVEGRLAGSSITIRARAVVGAHGKRSGVDRSLNRAFLRQPAPFIGLKSHLYGPPLPNRIELHVFPGGYCGFSEVENGGANVCLLVRQDVFHQHRSIPAFIEWMSTQNPHLGRWLSGAKSAGEDWLSIAQVSFARKPPIERDVLMAGDSAGLIAPLAGDGMAMALRGGELAATLLNRFLDGALSADGLRRGYTTAWEREFWGRLRLGRALQSLMLRPPALVWGLRLINHMPRIGQYLVNHTRDLSDVRP